MWEVVYPTSRAVELGEEDEEEDRQMFGSRSASPVVRLSRCLKTKENSSTVSCKLLVLAFGRIATTFVEAHFLNSDSMIVGVVACGKKEKDLNSLLQTAPSDKTCFIYSSISAQESRSSEVLFCQSKVEYPAECCHDWAKEIFSSIKADKVLILSTKPAFLCSLSDSSEEDSDCVFALKTNNWKSTVKFPFLKSPNVVSDLPAAVLTYCQIFHTPAVLYVGITATDAVDSRAVEMFHALLKEDPLRDVSKRSSTETLEFLKSVKTTSPHLDSNMYI